MQWLSAVHNAVQRRVATMDPEKLMDLNNDVREGRVRIWHGGAPDLRPGDLILPPASTGAESMRQESIDAEFRRVVTAPDLVYVTTERELARAIAAHWAKRRNSQGRGWLYRVSLDDVDLAPDDDLPCGPFISFQAARVRVAAVFDRGVDPDNPRHMRELEKFVRLIG